MSTLFFDQLFSFFSDSFGIGLTPEDIIDRLVSTDNNKTGNNKKKGGKKKKFFFLVSFKAAITNLLIKIDENIIPIFLTFFRKFMKPFELVKTLVDR